MRAAEQMRVREAPLGKRAAELAAKDDESEAAVGDLAEMASGDNETSKPPPRERRAASS
jgi:hypothetical protein